MISTACDIYSRDEVYLFRVPVCKGEFHCRALFGWQPQAVNKVFGDDHGRAPSIKEQGDVGAVDFGRESTTLVKGYGSRDAFGLGDDFQVLREHHGREGAEAGFMGKGCGFRRG